MDIHKNETVNWTSNSKILFRFLASFFAIHQLLSPDLYLFLFGYNVKILDWFNQLYQPLYDYINQNYLHLKQTDGRLLINDFLFEIVAIVFTLMLTLLWSLIDRKRISYNQANFWLQHFLKYSLAIVLFAYGMDKLVPVQMPLPSTEALDLPIGYYHPSFAFWNLMGSQSFYQSFSGLAEISGVLLLLFKRTKVIGLIFIFGTLVNILMLNVGFDIGVTYYIINLLIVCIYLLYPYLQSIFQFFIQKDKVKIYEQSIYPLNKGSRFIYYIPIMLFIISAFFNIKKPIQHYLAASKVNQSSRTFDVLTQLNNTDTIKMTLGDTLRWKYITTYIQDGKEFATISTMSYGNKYNFRYNRDSLGKFIYLFDDKRGQKYSFAYSIDNASKELKLIDSSQHFELVIKEFTNEDWPLLKKRNKFLPFD